jgi:hypothetical protein
MATLESALNFIIPWVVGIAGVWILYRPLKEPLAPLIRGIGAFFRWIGRKITGEPDEEQEIIPVLQYE